MEHVLWLIEHVEWPIEYGLRSICYCPQQMPRIVCCLLDVAWCVCMCSSLPREYCVVLRKVCCLLRVVCVSFLASYIFLVVGLVEHSLASPAHSFGSLSSCRVLCVACCLLRVAYAVLRDLFYVL